MLISSFRSVNITTGIYNASQNRVLSENRVNSCENNILLQGSTLTFQLTSLVASVNIDATSQFFFTSQTLKI